MQIAKMRVFLLKCPCFLFFLLKNFAAGEKRPTFAMSNRNNNIKKQTKMKTISNIFNAIQGLNTVSKDIYGDFTVQAGAQEKAEDIRSEIRDYISADSLAAKILATATRFSEKQLWVIAYELDRNGYGKKLEEVSAAAAAREAYRKAAKSRRNAAKKQAKQAIEERAQANAAYTAGTEVEHAAFGNGVVKSNNGNTIVVVFENGEEKAFAAKFVRFA